MAQVKIFNQSYSLGDGMSLDMYGDPSDSAEPMTLGVQGGVADLLIQLVNALKNNQSTDAIMAQINAAIPGAMTMIPFPSTNLKLTNLCTYIKNCQSWMTMNRTRIVVPPQA